MASSGSSFVLVPDHAALGWTVAAVSAREVKILEVQAPAAPAPDGADDAGKVAVALAQLLRDQGYRGEPTVLALPSSWCLPAALRRDRLPRKQRHQALIYRLEEHLPLPVEQLACDVAEPPGASVSNALGVAVQLSHMRPIVNCLEQAGIAVQHVCPAALLAAQQLAERSAEPPDILVLAMQDRLELVMLDARVAIEWCSLPAGDTDSLSLWLGGVILRYARSVRITVCGLLSDAVQRVLSDHPDVTLVQPDAAASQATIEQAARRAAALLSGHRLRPWIELRQGALALAHPLRAVRRPLLVAAAAVLAAAASLIIVAHWRAAGYERLTQQLRDRQVQVFQTVQPGQPVPQAVLLRLTSEHRKLQGLRGSFGAPIERPKPALVLLHGLLSHLPRQVRLRLLEIRLEPGRIVLDGQTRTHADADAIAAALRDGAGWSVRPPRTEQLKDQAVSFTIQAEVDASRPAPLARGGGP